MWYPLMHSKRNGTIGFVLAVMIVLISFGGMTVALAAVEAHGGHAPPCRISNDSRCPAKGLRASGKKIQAEGIFRGGADHYNQRKFAKH